MLGLVFVLASLLSPLRERDEQIVTEHQCLGGHGLAVVIALVKRDHRLGHGGKYLVAGE
jgi:hypothetical protein